MRRTLWLVGLLALVIGLVVLAPGVATAGQTQVDDAQVDDAQVADAPFVAATPAAGADRSSDLSFIAGPTDTCPCSQADPASQQGCGQAPAPPAAVKLPTPSPAAAHGPDSATTRVLRS